jgi:hypothetical protein
MKVTLLLPPDLGNRFSLCQARRYARVLPQSLISLIYHLVAKTLAHGFLHPERAYFSVLFSTRELQCSLLFSRSFSPLLLSCRSASTPELLPFFPSSTRLRGSESPTHGQVWKPYRWVPCPISSLTLEEGLPTTSLTGNSFMGQRTVENYIQ